MHHIIYNTKLYKGYNIIPNMADKRDDVKTVSKVLKTRRNGFTITQIKEETELPRCSVNSALDKLEGAKKVEINIFGRSKVYSWKGNI